MSITANTQKKCPQCGKINLPDDNFCKECGFEFKQYKAGDFVIIENLKLSLYGSLTCIFIFIGFMILVSYGVITELGLLSILALLIIWPIILGFLFWASRYLRGLAIDRKFIITDEFIEIIVPHRPYFKINWSEFDSIEITKRESMATIPTGDAIILGPRFVYFKLIFKGVRHEESFEFESGKDFKVRTKKKILTALQQYAEKKGKNFTGWRWKDKKRERKALKE
ncbi:MAG: zinc ribbon domain-containing protein [Promethearchaeota archaeon]|nr:MAG: zinc ribbon domain-containing protein [Candidatus Lokiarchaeota archaeon]